MLKLEIQIQLWIIALKSKNKFRKIQLSPCSADVHSHWIPGEGWEENLKYLNGFTEGFATEIWASLTPFTSVWHLLYKIRRWWKGETKAMLAFQFLVLPVQDTSSQMFWGLWVFFYSWYQKLLLFFVFFFCDLFSLSVLSEKQVCIPRGKLHVGPWMWSSCSSSGHVAALLLWDAQLHRQPWLPPGWDPASEEQDLQFHIKWDTVVLFVCFFNIEPYIF